MNFITFITFGIVFNMVHNSFTTLVISHSYHFNVNHVENTSKSFSCMGNCVENTENLTVTFYFFKSEFMNLQERFIYEFKWFIILAIVNVLSS